jgi:hypothetical protein
MKRDAMSKPVIATVTLLAVYFGGYIAMREARAERWERDGQVYVIYPDGAGRLLYYAWRPLSYLDARLTGMRSHIGPHR